MVEVYGMKYTKEGILFESTGRDEYMANGFIGLRLDGDLDVSYGYDGVLASPCNPLTLEEAKELATHMILTWEKWAREYTPEKAKAQYGG